MPAHNLPVVDDRSGDRTAAVVASVPGVRLLTNTERLGKQGSIRRAIAEFALVERYEFVALLDADSYVDPGYFVEAHAATLAASNR